MKQLLIGTAMIAATALIVFAGKARAHDAWANGEPVPAVGQEGLLRAGRCTSPHGRAGALQQRWLAS